MFLVKTCSNIKFCCSLTRFCLHTMGLDICPVHSDGQEHHAFWPQQRLHYTWMRFMSLMRIITHNAVLTDVASIDDATVALMRHVNDGNTWTTEQCRAVHVLIRKTFNASTVGPDLQAAKALEEARAQATAFQQQVTNLFADGANAEARVIMYPPSLDAKAADDEEEDSMHVDNEEGGGSDDADEENNVPRVWLKYPKDVGNFWNEDYDAMAIEFGETMAVFYANGWGAYFG